MIRRSLSTLVFAVLVGCAAKPSPTPPVATSARALTPPSPVPPSKENESDWVAKSNENTKLLLEVTSKFVPEESAQLGVEGVDDQILDWRPGHAARRRVALEGVLDELRRRAEREPNALVRQDLVILVHAADLAVRRSKLEEDNLVPYLDPTGLVFGATLALLDDQVAPARRSAIVARLRKYAGQGGGAPLTDLVRAEMREAMAKPKLVMPSRIEVEKDLANGRTMRDGIDKLLAKYEIHGFEEARAALMKQLVLHEDFVRQDVLPKARATFALPPPVYAIALEGYGVDLPPAELTTLAHDGFTKIQAQMVTVAAEVAKSRKLPGSDYRDVLRALKKEQVRGDAILPLYKERLADIEAIIVREKLVSLPSRPARIRLGTPAENAQMPAPHMQPPRLLGNTGEQGEFILPLEVPLSAGKKPGEGKLDDFTFSAAAWTLTAHEARPGHELQFAAMIERGVSTARAVYAFNSANVEGWGLYSEAILYPFMPPEGRLVSLQLRLHRAARAFLDPELQQGKWTFDSAKTFLMKEVGLSAAMATSEAERYTFRSPGQATSYYYGFLKLQDLRREIELKLGPKFDAKRFHDFLLAQGLLPPPLLRAAVLEEFGG